MSETVAGPGEVVFVVGVNKVRIKALRGLLGISSPIFREMFEETKEDEIVLPCIDSDAFEIVLSHIRGNDVHKSINKKNMCNILYISNKYLLQKLSRIASKFVTKTVDKTNILQLYTFAQSLDDDKLKSILWRYLGRKSLKITEPIISQIFQSLNGAQIANLLQKDYISIREERIFTHCLNWLKTQYQRKDKQINLKANPSELMADFLQYIRFPLMSNKFLSNDVYFAGILSDRELVHIFRAKSLKDKTLTPYNIRKRPKYAGGNDYEGSDELQDVDGENSDNEFDDINMDGSDDDEEKIDYNDITDKVKPILNSGECGGYPMQNMYVDGTRYWCSSPLTVSVDCWLIFDCGDYNVSKIDIKFQSTYACSIVKIYCSDNKRASRVNWDKITRKINMPKGGTVHEIKVRNEDQMRYLLIKFEDWMNGYAGVERIHFYSDGE